jgi:hypothetical protein
LFQESWKNKPAVSELEDFDGLESNSVLYGTDLSVSFTENCRIDFAKLGRQNWIAGETTVSAANQLLLIRAGSLDFCLAI